MSTTLSSPESQDNSNSERKSYTLNPVIFNNLLTVLSTKYPNRFKGIETRIMENSNPRFAAEIVAKFAAYQREVLRQYDFDLDTTVSQIANLLAYMSLSSVETAQLKEWLVIGYLGQTEQ